MAKCKKCGGKKVRRMLRTYSIEPVVDQFSSETATVYFHRTFNLTVNGVPRQYSPGERAVLNYPTIRGVLMITPSNPPVSFVFEDQKRAYEAAYGTND